MGKAINLKRLFVFACLAFICGILIRMAILKIQQPDFMFYRTFEPQFALAYEQDN